MAKKYQNEWFESEERSDCERIERSAVEVFENLGECFESVLDERQTKTDVAKGLFGIGKSLTKLGWNLGSCAVKHAPKAAVAVAHAKREIVDTIEESYREVKKEQAEAELEARIRKLATKSTSKKRIVRS